MPDRDDSPITTAMAKKIDRRSVIKKSVLAGGIGYVAPMILGAATPVSAQQISGSACGCTTTQPCNVAIPCNNNSACNCWVLYDHSACFCGNLAPNNCVAAPCTTHATCPAGQACTDTCCGMACYPVCGVTPSAPIDPNLPSGTRRE